MRAAYTITIFAGALLLFLIQPLIGKRLLPLLGGTPAVWNTCLVFFQVMLLAGYVYAHLLTRVPGARRQVVLHGLVLASALIALPIGLRAGGVPPADHSPIGWLFGALLLSVGLPFFVVSTSAPLLQRWFAATDDRRAGDPYFLYAASNAGSLMALLAYPLLVETTLTLDLQRLAWSGGYLAFAALTVSCGALLLRRPGSAPLEAALGENTTSRPASREYLKWTVLAFVPSSLMLGATQHITTDVAAVPLLWVVPLAIYLLTYILAFARRRTITANVASWLLIPLAIGALWAPKSWWNLPILMILGLHLTLLFMAAVTCHGRLAESRPHPRHLTSFYLAIAMGGALGGVFNALVAPLVFDTVLEYPLMIALAFLLRKRPPLGPLRGALARWLHRGLDVAIIVLAVLFRPLQSVWPDARIVLTDRTFFGVHWVAHDEGRRLIGYCQGSTVHGFQSLDDRSTPLAYYHDKTGIGRIFEQLVGDQRLNRVGIVGLGTGAIGAYAEPGQSFTFFEIDPAVVRIARDVRLFTHVSDMPEEPTIVLGDGRLGIARVPDGEFGLIILDAFTSDAVPVHLLTAEAFDLYFRKLAPDGLLAVQATNRHVDLALLIAGLARDRALYAYEWMGPGDIELHEHEGRYPTRWLVLASSETSVAPLLEDPLWQRVPEIDGAPVWTDDFSNIVALFRWWRG